MERRLLLLGLLQENHKYGYQINGIIDSQVGMSLQLTKPTTYRILHNLTEDGLITYHEEQQGNRPTRRVYAITPKGRREFRDKLKESLGEFNPPENSSVIALAFMDALPQEEMLSLLEERKASIENMLLPIMEDRTLHDNFKIVNENQILHLSAELEWLRELIQDL